MSGAARASSSSTALDVPASGSETITLNFAIVAELSSSAMKVGCLSFKSCAFRFCQIVGGSGGAGRASGWPPFSVGNNRGNVVW
jgi:hypothetical protein